MQISSWTFKSRMLAIAGLAITPIVLIILIFNFSIRGPIQEQLLRDTASGITQQMQSANAQVTQIEAYANTLADTTTDTDVPDTMTTVPSTQAGLNRLIAQLFLLQNDSELIQRAQILITGKHPYVINATGTSLLTANLHKLCANRKTRAWVPTAHTLNLVQPLTNFHQTAFLVVELDDQSLLSRYQASITKRFTYLCFGNRTAGHAPQTANDQWQDHQTVLIKNVRYQITRQQASHLGRVWSYYSLFSLDATFAIISRVSLSIAIVSIIAVALTLALIYLIRTSFYTPVTNLLKLAGTPPETEGTVQNELHYLQTKWEQLLSDHSTLTQAATQNHSHIVNNFWHQALQGQLAYLTPEEFTQQAEKLDLTLDTTHPMCFLRLVLTDQIPRPNVTLDTDQALNQFIFANVVNDLATAHFNTYYLLDTQADAALLLVTSIDEPVLQSFAHVASDSLNHLLGRYLTVLIGTPIMTFSQLHEAYDAIDHAIGYQVLRPQNQHFFLNHLPRTAKAPLSTVTESTVLSAVRNQESLTAKKALTAMLEPYFSAGLRQHLLFVAVEKLYYDLSSLLQGYDIDTTVLPNIEALRRKLRPLLTQSGVNAVLTQHLLIPAMRSLQAYQNQSGRQKLELILTYLAKNYADPQLSLELTAEQYEMDSYTLSRLFKQATGVTYTDYLTDLRLEAAKHALRKTNQHITEIAQAVGYQPSYFNRLFKKKVGITPGQFRKQS